MKEKRRQSKLLKIEKERQMTECIGSHQPTEHKSHETQAKDERQKTQDMSQKTHEKGTEIK